MSANHKPYNASKRSTTDNILTRITYVLSPDAKLRRYNLVKLKFLKITIMRINTLKNHIFWN